MPNSKRQSIIDACLEMNDSGLNQGTSGNISLRHKGGILITPTSLPYNQTTLDDIVWMGFNGDTKGTREPSSEWRFHLDIMRAKPDVNAIVHAHPTYSTALAIMGMEIPAVHYMVAAAGGNTILCAPYATYGTEELSVHATKALKNRAACLLKHHGMIATGATLDKAMWLAIEVETLARQYHACLQIGTPPILPDEEIDRVLKKFGNYGHQTD
ncbi:MAG: L-fuculose-phosphate aldolase [Paracoccaceae bacterium]